MDKLTGKELEEAIANRKAARQMAIDAAIQGDGICGALFALESLAEPFYLGLDYSDDIPDEDDCRPY